MRATMFGKTKEPQQLDGPVEDDLTVEDFFGDEDAAAEAHRVDELGHRLANVEGQLHSQFTSMAAYAQIAQEQIEMARAEAKAATERTEHRLIDLIERERKDRIDSATGAPGGGNGWASPEVDARLDALELSVAEIRHGLNECLARQKALADAITALFEPHGAASDLPPAPDGPIADLSIA